MSDFKPSFKGFMKIFLHDDDYKKAASRAIFTEQWQQSRRHKILKRERKFLITLHIFDTDGNKRGLKGLAFMVKGGHQQISKTIFNFGNEFVDELREEFEDIKIDLTNSYAVVRA